MRPPTPVNLFLICGLLSGCTSTRTPAKSAARTDAPEFSLEDRHGDLKRLSDYRGKVLVLDFWATWCLPCRVQIPWFNELVLRYQDQGLAVLGVSMDEKGWQAVDPFARELQINYPVVLADERVVRRYGAGPPPTAFLTENSADLLGAGGEQEENRAAPRIGVSVTNRGWWNLVSMRSSIA